MDIFYDDLFGAAEGASSTILEAANSIADPVGDQLTEEGFESIINDLISNLDVSNDRYKDGIEKLRKLL
jgi:hypothetical protein